MKMSRLHIKTLKDSPFEGELEGQNYLFRAGMIKKIGVAEYSFMPYGLGLLEKINSKINFDFEGEDFQKINFSSESGVIDAIKMLRSDIISYKELPKRFFYDSISKRDDYRVKLGIMKSKSFVEKSFISISKNDDDMKSEKSIIKEGIEKILLQMGIEYGYACIQEKTDLLPSSYGFYAKSVYGDEEYFNCENCGYSSISHSAKCGYEKTEEDELEMCEILTPEVKTISDLEKFLDISSHKLLKTLILSAVIDGEVKNIAVTLRGDRELNLNKLARILNISVKDISLEEQDEVLESLGTFIGFAGPVGMKNAIIISDEEVIGIKNMVTGANKYNYHFKNVNYGRDYKADIIADVKYNVAGDICPICVNSLNSEAGFAISLDTEYGVDLGEILDIKYRDENMKDQYCSILHSSLDLYKIMGMYIEENNDENGLCLNEDYSEYDYQVLIVNTKKEDQVKLGEEIYEELLNRGFSVLLDDRDERPGSKFKDSDLMGIPARIVAGKNSLERIVEFKERKATDKIEITLDELMEKCVNVRR